MNGERFLSNKNPIVDSSLCNSFCLVWGRLRGKQHEKLLTFFDFFFLTFATIYTVFPPFGFIEKGHHYYYFSFQKQLKLRKQQPLTRVQIHFYCVLYSLTRFLCRCKTRSNIFLKQKKNSPCSDKISVPPCVFAGLCQAPWPTSLRSQPQIVYYLIDLITEKKINQR